MRSDDRITEEWKHNMTGAKLKIQWDDTFETVIPARVGRIDTDKAISPAAYTRQIVCETRKLRCPHCESIVYSRRSQWCGVCGEPLPKNFQFSPHESERIESLLRAERERYRKWKERVFRRAFES